MATIVTRAGKGSPLTNTEVDSNFTNLNTDKLEDITGESIKDLSDVYSAMSPTDGQVLTYDTTNGWQAEDTATPVSSIQDLTDVNTMTPADGQLLTWDNANSRWDAADAPVSLPDQTGNANYVLTTDGSTASWTDTITNLKSGGTINLTSGDFPVGTSNTALGSGCFASLDAAAQYSTAIGTNALGSATSAPYNTAIGNDALGSLTTGASNTAVGWDALAANATSGYNTAVGVQAARNVTNQANTAIGFRALYTETTGGNHVCVGYYAGYSLSGKTQVTCVGYQAGRSASQSYQTHVGSRAGYNSNGYYQTNVGYYAGYNLKGDSSTAVGGQAGYGSSSYTTVINNSFFGYQAGYTIYGGDYNTAIGSNSGSQLNNGSYNALLGYYAGYGNSNNYNTYVGANAGREADGTSNVSIGYYAGYYLDGDYNIAIGRNALDESSITGDYNIGIGYNSTLSATTANNECQIGAPNGSTGQITRLDVGGCDFSMNTTALYYGAEIRAGGDVVAYYSSDATLKENVQNIPDALSKVNAIRGVTYDWKDDYLATKGKVDDYFNRKHDVGVIAQEVEAVLPEVVAERKDGTKAVRYEKLTALLIEAINDLTNEVQTLKAELKELKDGIS